MKYSAAVLALMGSGAMAFPAAVMEALSGMAAEEMFEKRQGTPAPGSSGARALSAARGNCGVVPCLVFSAQEQYVSTSGPNAYMAPVQGQVRGPCPGLNAAANHGYISRTGFVGVADIVTGLGQAYGMSPDLAGFLAAYAILEDGNPADLTWSIGGRDPPGQGISCSHNNYEGDSSLSRADAYINHGDAHSLIMSRFVETYSNRFDRSKGSYTLDTFSQDFEYKADQSVQTNPYYFSAPFAGLVAPAAYNFVINFMSNHTAANPNGYFDQNMFKTFFAVSGNNPNNFKWNRGQERIPDNWYRRTSTNQYNAVNVFMDLGVEFLAYPDTFRLGGNTGRTNSYVGVSLGQYTGQTFTSLADLSGCNGVCYASQYLTSILPSSAPGSLLTLITGATGSCKCPTAPQFQNGQFSKYPGSAYAPSGDTCADLTYKL